MALSQPVYSIVTLRSSLARSGSPKSTWLVTLPSASYWNVDLVDRALAPLESNQDWSVSVWTAATASPSNRRPVGSAKSAGAFVERSMSDHDESVSWRA